MSRSYTSPKDMSRKRPRQAWRQIGTTGLNYAYAMTVNGSSFYVGGRTAGSQSQTYLWDATNNEWDNSGQPNAGEPSVISMVTHSSVVYTGLFNTSEVWHLTPPSTWTQNGTPGADTTVTKLIEHDGTIWCSTGSTSGGVYEWAGADSWTNRGQPGSLATSRITSDGTNVFAGGNGSQTVYQWDSGTDWTDIDDCGSAGFVHDLHYFNGVLYVAMSDSSPAKVYKYTDPGWSVVGTLSDASRIYCLGDDGSYLYAGTYDDCFVYRRNADNDWSKIGSFTEAGFDTVLSCANFNSQLNIGMGSGSGQVMRLGA